MAEFRTAFEGITGVVVEDTPFSPENDASDEPFFLTAEERSARGAAAPPFPVEP